MKITVKQLIALNACAGQVKTFRRLFGASATVTLANCIKAVKAEMSFDWAARYLLSAPARDAYDKAIVTAGDAYKKAIATAWDTCKKTTIPAWDAYDKAIATAFYSAVISDNKLARQQGGTKRGGGYVETTSG